MNLLATAAIASLGLWTASWIAPTAKAALGARLRAGGAPRGRLPAGATGLEGLRVHLIRPCAGVDAGLEANLRSIERASWPAGIELHVTLATGRVDDPATPVTEAVAEKLVGLGFRVRARNYALGPEFINQKVGQLARADAEVRSDVVINVDSDVDLDGFDFGPLISALAADEDERIGAAWAPPVEVRPRTRADLASRDLLSASLHAFVALSVLDPAGLVGKCFAVRTEALRESGGFESYATWLGEDMELSRRLRAAGWGTRCVHQLVASTASGRTKEQVLDRYARWFSVIRWQRPALLASYPLLFFAALPLGLAWSVVGLFEPSWGALGLLVVLLWRAVFAQAVLRSSTPEYEARVGLGGALWRGLRADWTIARAFVRCLRLREVTWRGRSLKMQRGGELAPTSLA